MYFAISLCLWVLETIMLHLPLRHFPPPGDAELKLNLNGLDNAVNYLEFYFFTMFFIIKIA